MKKIILILLLGSLLFTSCKKEEQEECPQQNCECVTILGLYQGDDLPKPIFRPDANREYHYFTALDCDNNVVYKLIFFDSQTDFREFEQNMSEDPTYCE
jgi:hypothetical protein